MFNTKDRIYIQQWLELKPYKKQTKTDNYYLNISNIVRRKLLDDNSFLAFDGIDSEYIANFSACFLTSYFEDIISETNLFKSFVKEHKKIYNRPLPFYNCEEYYEDEINIQDVRFLIWYLINLFQEEVYISSNNEMILNTALAVMEVFEEAYEYAPVNEDLNKYYTIGENETDFYTARLFIDKILFNSYLFSIDTEFKYKDIENEIIENHLEKIQKNPSQSKSENEHFKAELKNSRDNNLHFLCTKLLAYNGRKWAAALIGEKHPLYIDFIEMSDKIDGFFLYKGQDEDDIFIQHIASEKNFILTKKSFEDYNKLKKIDTILFIGIVKWKNKWWFSGINSIIDFDSRIIETIKKTEENMIQVGFLENKNRVKEKMQIQYDAFMDFTNGKQLVFIKTIDFIEFMSNFTKHYNSLVIKEKPELKKYLENDEFEKNSNLNIDIEDKPEEIIVFFNPIGGLEIAFDIHNAFPTADNPFFNKNLSDEHVFRLLFDENISTELAMFCVDNFKAKLDFFKSNSGKEILNNLDFLLRFWKHRHYFSSPQISNKGKNEKEYY